MKISLALLAAAPIAALGKRTFLSHKKGTVVHRRANEDEEDDGEEDYTFLQSYEQVYVTCDPDQVVYNQEGEAEYGAVVYRLCPSGTACSEKGEVCSSGHGDYVVGLQTYMERFMQQFERDNEDNDNGQNGNDDFDFNFAEFGECKQFDVEAQEDEDDEDGQDNQEAEVAYFLGPMCTEDGDIKIALFAGNENMDEEAACQPQYESVDVTFEDLTGIELPWSTSILEDEDCKAYYCYGKDNDGNYDYNEFCTELYEQAWMKCEEEMETFSAYGQDVSSCEAIAEMLPASSSGGSGAGWFIFALLIAAVAGFGIWYFLQQKKKAAVNQEGLMM